VIKIAETFLFVGRKSSKICEQSRDDDDDDEFNNEFSYVFFRRIWCEPCYKWDNCAFMDSGVALSRIRRTVIIASQKKIIRFNNTVQKTLKAMSHCVVEIYKGQTTYKIPRGQSFSDYRKQLWIYRIKGLSLSTFHGASELFMYLFSWMSIRW